ncbi:MAG: glycosyltransferase family 39 protein [Promethearchaeota archaeon]
MHKTDKKLAILLFILALIPRILGINRDQVHRDEQVYVRYGYQYIVNIIELNFDRTYWMETYHNFEHPPLAKLLFGMAIFFSKDHIDPLIAARLVVVIIGSLTVIVLFFFTKELYNRRFALLSALFLSFQNTHVFHSRLAMLDVPLAFFYLLTLFFFYKGLKGNGKYILISAITLGLAIGTKYTGLLLIPTAISILLINYLKIKEIGEQKMLIFPTVTLTKFIFFLLWVPIGLLIVFLLPPFTWVGIYWLSDVFTELTKYWIGIVCLMVTIFILIYFISKKLRLTKLNNRNVIQLPSISLRKAFLIILCMAICGAVLAFIINTALPNIIYVFSRPFAYHISHTQRGHTVLFFGRQVIPPWYFYIVVLILALTPYMLGFIIFGSYNSLRRRQYEDRFIWCWIINVLVLSSFSTVKFGPRFILQVFPCLMILGALGIEQILELRNHIAARNRMLWVGCIFVCLDILFLGITFPYYFEYFSEFFGVSIGHEPFVRGLIRDDVPASF